MMNKNEIEAILKVNDVPKSSSDDEIRSVLLSARYNENEVDAAILILRQNTKTSEKKIEGLHKVFRTDRGLQPDEIYQLLGINVEVSDIITERRLRQKVSISHLIIIGLASLIVAILGLLSYMYSTDLGILIS